MLSKTYILDSKTFELIKIDLANCRVYAVQNIQIKNNLS